jgi:hypothetical protein
LKCLESYPNLRFSVRLIKKNKSCQCFSSESIVFMDIFQGTNNVGFPCFYELFLEKFVKRNFIMYMVGSWDSVVVVATGYGLDDQGVRVRVPVGSRIFSCPCHPDRLWGPPNLLSNGYQGLFPLGLKWLECETDQSPPACAEVKKMCICTSTPPYTFTV